LTPSSPDDPAHVYCQVDESDNREMTSVGQSGANGTEDEDEEEQGSGGDEYTPMREIRIYLPDSKCTLNIVAY
jgi:nucleotide-sensitive chloride channel 1A